MDTNIGNLIFTFFKVDKIFLFIFLIVLIVVFIRVVNLWSEKFQEKLSGKRLLILQVTTVFSFATYLLGTLGAFYFVFRPSKELLLTVGGSAAVAFGFALKDLVGSVIAGFILLFDRPFQVGDRVSYGDSYGEIKSIGLRSVKLQTLNDDTVTIPNSKFLTDTVASGNSGALDMMIVTTFYVSIHEDLERVKKLLHEVVITSRFVFLEKPVTIIFEEVPLSNDFVVKVNVKAYVLDVKFEKLFLTDITIRGNKILKENHILRPGSTHINEVKTT
ncbi:putative mechanosensitive ion channel protein [Halobacteriovorax marinus SJ]|uniref:Mechanosensitive ion channel protein n=1 Tax=Halobacteriovorax marinus (strain ATCC BAA-682 / DSM 15412 / SJ) TaxID=862908 RepID=E1WYB1_HALMS|nr:mechanosensitive ion channel domain-containing protein [Halobacteriovorax marinus]CBW25959.1 putative mechanosensitive ion channel protein [Halobacteriovorax marinus SJ]